MAENKVSVIVPIYGVEKFIGRCACSLFEQTLRDGVEYIFVDDATPDDSIKVLKECLAKYPERAGQVEIITHSTNKGLPAARNTGLGRATGTYVVHCDSDDYVEPTMLQEMLTVAERENADIVWSDWYLTFGQNERYMKQPAYGTPIEALKGMLSGLMKFNVWNKMARRSLYVENGISFPSGYGMGEDMTIMRLFACAARVAYVPRAFYHYVRQNTTAFCNTYSERHLVELRHNVDSVASQLVAACGRDTIGDEIEFFKLEAKFPFLLSDRSDKYKLWKEWYPEANEYIMRNKHISGRRRLLQWCAWKGQYWIVSLYYLLLHKLVYGVIFK